MSRSRHTTSQEQPRTALLFDGYDPPPIGGWFNNHRPHTALGGRTPIEAWCHEALPEPIPIYARDDETPEIDVRRINYRGDPGLPVIRIHLTKETRRAA